MNKINLIAYILKNKYLTFFFFYFGLHSSLVCFAYFVAFKTDLLIYTNSYEQTERLNV